MSEMRSEVREANIGGGPLLTLIAGRIAGVRPHRRSSRLRDAVGKRPRPVAVGRHRVRPSRDDDAIGRMT
jgi:hypothetical protein